MIVPLPSLCGAWCGSVYPSGVQHAATPTVRQVWQRYGCHTPHYRVISYLGLRRTGSVATGFECGTTPKFQGRCHTTLPHQKGRRIDAATNDGGAQRRQNEESLNAAMGRSDYAPTGRHGIFTPTGQPTDRGGPLRRAGWLAGHIDGTADRTGGAPTVLRGGWPNRAGYAADGHRGGGVYVKGTRLGRPARCRSGHAIVCRCVELGNWLTLT
jgi:hypothetical protein